MKKKVSTLIVVTIFVSILFFNLKLSSKSSNLNDIRLENIEALACYPLEVDGIPMANCCEPWYNWCWYFNGVPIPGWPT